MKLSFLAVAGMALVAPAAASAAVTFNGVCAGSATLQQAACTSISGAYGNSASIQAVDDATLKLKITAWQANQATSGTSANKITSAFLGAYSGGFGVTGVQDVDGNGVAGGNGTHQIDNVNGYTDFVLLQFSRSVHLEGLGLNLYSPYNDTDSSAWNGSAITPATWNSTINLAGATLDASLWSNTAGGSSSGYRNISANGFSQVWLVSASVLTTDRNDGFKLSSIIVTPQVIATPEPATWAMMIIGFGGIGATLRRRRSSGAPQAA